MQKKSIFFLIPAFIAVSQPVLSQANFASLKSVSPINQDKRFSGNITDYPAMMRPVMNPFSSSGGFISSSVKSDNNREENSYSNDRNTTTNVAIIETNKEAKKENIEISFRPTSFSYPENSRVDVGVAKYSSSQLILYAKVLKEYAIKNGYDTNYAFLSNMGMLSNRKRFFVVNLVTMQIEQSGLVAHGRGQGKSVYDKQYSNKSGSKCTSLGRYKIAGKYKGSYGESYRMTGLDTSNKNAYSRNIVLHSMGCIPDIDGIMPACVSEGCPAVSTNFLTSLRKIIDTRKKPVLLWIFDSNLEEAVAERVKSAEELEEEALNKFHSCKLHPRERHQIVRLP